MANMFDYLLWRGDLPFSAAPVNPVDALIFSTLVYLQFDGIVTELPAHPITLREAAAAIAAQPAPLLRDERDRKLLLAAAETERFGNAGLCFYREEFLPEEQTQFAAMTFVLDDGSAFLAFRGTDGTLVGWKEDFNMSFLQAVPAQFKATRYTGEFAAAFPGPLHLGGHSKGGNLAVFAAAKNPALQERLVDVYNLDGPGFGEYLMGDEGYLAIVPKVHTFIPQSSIIGIILEHEEAYTVIKSSQVSVMQHEPHSWELLGSSFLKAGELAPDVRFADRTIRQYLADTTPEERGRFVDAVYDLLTVGNAERVGQLLHPKNMQSILRSLSTDDSIRTLLTAELERIVQTVKGARSAAKDTAEG